MNRHETILAFILAGVLIAGVGHEAWRGAPKGAELVIARSANLPFEAEPAAETVAPATAPQALPVEAAAIAEGLAFINRASVNELQSLPGVGEVLARRIAEHRSSNGPFTRLDQLMNVNGIGAAKLEDIDRHLRQMKRPTPQRRQSFQPPAPMNRYPAPAGRSGQTTSLNTATLDQLTAISGIGPSIANSILDARQERGAFRSWDDVDAISGIGPSRLETLKANFSLE